ncbi:MAG: hypothetical protein J3Q66DRAFT_442620 [Benniella sp.]|nr:MAG: hypothetical protein J3Q66DRAFT_442620 [Benniella sp.]
MVKEGSNIPSGVHLRGDIVRHIFGEPGHYPPLLLMQPSKDTSAVLLKPLCLVHIGASSMSMAIKHVFILMDIRSCYLLRNTDCKRRRIVGCILGYLWRLCHTSDIAITEYLSQTGELYHGMDPDIGCAANKNSDDVKLLELKTAMAPGDKSLTETKVAIKVQRRTLSQLPPQGGASKHAHQPRETEPRKPKTPYERWTKDDEAFLLQYTKPIKLQEALGAYRDLRAQQGKEKRSEKPVRLILYKLANEDQGIIPGFDTDVVHRVVFGVVWSHHLEARRKEVIHASELERIHELEEKLCTEFGMTQENP